MGAIAARECDLKKGRKETAGVKGAVLSSARFLLALFFCAFCGVAHPRSEARLSLLDVGTKAWNSDVVL